MIMKKWIVDKIINGIIGWLWLAVLCGGFFCLSKCVYASETVKCKRPRWKVVYVEELGCKMDYRHYFLFEKSKGGTRSERSANGFCKVLRGIWEVRSEEGMIELSDPALIDIDHIVPVAYFARRIDCARMNDYYNFEDNLVLTTKTYNNKKKANLCRFKEECQEQAEKCINMAAEFDNAPLCTDLLLGKYD